MALVPNDYLNLSLSFNILFLKSGFINHSVWWTHFQASMSTLVITLVNNIL